MWFSRHEKEPAMQRVTMESRQTLDQSDRNGIS
jgi:hypothetical protein